jgi:hypothetical protein
MTRFLPLVKTGVFEFSTFGEDVFRRTLGVWWPDDQSGWRWESSLSHFRKFSGVVYGIASSDVPDVHDNPAPRNPRLRPRLVLQDLAGDR